MKTIQFEPTEVIYAHCAGIDVGSRSHFVAVGQSKEDVREFGVYTSDHQKMVEFLFSRGITHVAMESTGSYFQSLLLYLQEAGFEVALVHGGATKNVSGRKSDVSDCMWIQKLFTFGFLRSCFLASTATNEIRTLNRHRNILLSECSRLLNRMGQSLRLMNIRLDVAINDLGGKTGQAIIKAIVTGERDSVQLAKLADARIRRSQKEMESCLLGRWNENQLYLLKDQYEMYQFVREKIKRCDEQISKCFTQIIESQGGYDEPNQLTKKQKSRNSTAININKLGYQIYGVDLMEIESVSEATVMSLLSEIGRDIYKFESSSKFINWLRLAPNNKITGSKVKSSKTPKGTNKFTLTLRNAANTISKQKTGYLLHFFQKIAFKKGRCAAITATARKIAIIIWNMIIKKEKYKPTDMHAFAIKQRNQTIHKLNNLINRMNIKADELILNNQAFAGS